jgi:threonine/homoserine/homoserine lactone efflux protein
VIDASIAASFTATAAAIVVTPGVGFVLFSSTMIAQGRRAAAAVGIGIIGGAAVLASIIIIAYPYLVGDAARVRRAMQLAGGGYLVYLAVRGFVRAWRTWDGDVSMLPTTPHAPATRARLIIEGVASSLTNPGLFVLYMFILPAFIVAVRPWTPAAATLAAIHIFLATTWYAVLFVALAHARSRLVSREWQTMIAIASSSLLMWLGVRLLVTR